MHVLKVPSTFCQSSYEWDEEGGDEGADNTNSSQEVSSSTINTDEEDIETLKEERVSWYNFQPRDKHDSAAALTEAITISDVASSKESLASPERIY